MYIEEASIDLGIIKFPPQNAVTPLKRVDFSEIYSDLNDWTWILSSDSGCLLTLGPYSKRQDL